MITVRSLEESDYEAWLPLWLGNNLGQYDETVSNETWKRLIDQRSSVKGLGAFIDNNLIGLLHFILHPVTGHIEPVCYMQDVFVDERYRRKGAAKALIEKLSQTGKKENWARIYWLAEEDNIAAQNLYKTTGLKLNFSLHIMPL